MQNIVADKSYAFAVCIVQLYQQISNEKKEYVLSKQLLRCGTSIGANVKEAEHAQSRADFCHKMNIALKEANETAYWLSLLKDTGYISESCFSNTIEPCKELIRLLAAIVKTTKA